MDNGETIGFGIQSSDDSLLLKIQSHIHDGNLAQRVNLSDLFGYVETVSVEPSTAPVGGSVYDQFKIYSDNLYWWNTEQSVWQFAMSGISQNVTSGTIATTGNTDCYYIAPETMTLFAVYFSGTDALATSDVNYITWTVTNLGQAGAGTNAMLLSDNLNTTKTTGGTAISANTKRSLVLTTTVNNLEVTQGDRIRIRAAVTGTLANTVTFPVYLLQFN